MAAQPNRSADEHATIAQGLLAAAAQSKLRALTCDARHGGAKDAAALLEALRKRGYAYCDGALGGAVLRGLQSAAEEMRYTMVTGVIGDHTAVADPDAAERTDAALRTDTTTRLSLADSHDAWHRDISAYSQALRSSLEALKTLLVDALYPRLVGVADASVTRLVGALPTSRPPLWPKEAMQFACYAPGAFYRRHPDTRHPARGGGAFREVTAIYYPNAGPWAEADGGGLRIWPAVTAGADGVTDGEPVTVQPVGDRLLLLASTLEHEVLPNTDSKGRARCAFTQWFWAARDADAPAG